MGRDGAGLGEEEEGGEDTVAAVVAQMPPWQGLGEEEGRAHQAVHRLRGTPRGPGLAG